MAACWDFDEEIDDWPSFVEAAVVLPQELTDCFGPKAAPKEWSAWRTIVVVLGCPPDGCFVGCLLVSGCLRALMPHGAQGSLQLRNAAGYTPLSIAQHLGPHPQVEAAIRDAIAAPAKLQSIHCIQVRTCG